MKLSAVLLTCLYLEACHPATVQETGGIPTNPPIDSSRQVFSYREIKTSITKQRQQFARQYADTRNNKNLPDTIASFWVDAISNQLYSKWQDTPWDFNGTTSTPKQGYIACGFFVTAILQDMDLVIHRRKLSICASSQMMSSLVPGQRINKLNDLSYADFADSLKRMPIGVYIMGLDYHTGFIVNDGTEVWFIHSYYVERKGVVREQVLGSSALQSSKTKWIISLTGDPGFIRRWLRL